MGYDGVFISNLDNTDRSYRISSKTLEFVWEGSPNLGKSNNHNFYAVTMTGSVERFISPPLLFSEPLK